MVPRPGTSPRALGRLRLLGGGCCWASSSNGWTPCRRCPHSWEALLRSLSARTRDPHRHEVLHYLLQGGEAAVRELSQATNRTPAALIAHFLNDSTSVADAAAPRLCIRTAVAAAAVAAAAAIIIITIRICPVPPARNPKMFDVQPRLSNHSFRRRVRWGWSMCTGMRARRGAIAGTVHARTLPAFAFGGAVATTYAQPR